MSIFLCAKLIDSAYKDAHYLIKLTLCCDLSSQKEVKLSTISADKTGIVLSYFVRFGVHGFRCFASIPDPLNFLSWAHREQDAPNIKQ